MNPPPTALRTAVIHSLEAAADPERAAGQQRYMKSEMPYHGVTTPVMRKLARAAFRDHPLDDRADWETAVLMLWRQATHREQRYVAIELADHRPYRRWLDPRALPIVEEMIVTGAWWDFVDALAANHLAAILDSDRATIRPVMWEWATDDLAAENAPRDGGLWRRRSAILVQLKAKERTDEELLFHAIEASMDSTEFFLRKAIGWALRQYAYTAPDTVVSYVEHHADRLSGLSKREALKNLG